MVLKRTVEICHLIFLFDAAKLFLVLLLNGVQWFLRR